MSTPFPEADRSGELLSTALHAYLSSEQRYRVLFDNNCDAVLHTAASGEVWGANAAACRLFGRTEAEIRQCGRGGIMTSAPHELTAASARDSTRGARYEATALRADGTTFPVEVQVQSINECSSFLLLRDLSVGRAAVATVTRALSDLEEVCRQVPPELQVAAGQLLRSLSLCLATMSGSLSGVAGDELARCLGFLQEQIEAVGGVAWPGRQPTRVDIELPAGALRRHVEEL